jgi:hypothetical protein
LQLFLCLHNQYKIWLGSSLNSNGFGNQNTCISTAHLVSSSVHLFYDPLPFLFPFVKPLPFISLGRSDFSSFRAYTFYRPNHQLNYIISLCSLPTIILNYPLTSPWMVNSFTKMDTMRSLCELNELISLLMCFRGAIQCDWLIGHFFMVFWWGKNNHRSSITINIEPSPT